MNFVRGLMLTLLIPCLSFADSRISKAPVEGQPVSMQVRELFQRWCADFEKKDLNALMKHYDRNMRFSMQGQPDQNLEQLRAAFAEDFQSRGIKASWRPAIDKIYSEGRLTVVIGVWDYFDEDQSGKIAVLYRIRSVDVLSRSADGLKIVHTVNYPMELSGP